MQVFPEITTVVVAGDLKTDSSKVFGKDSSLVEASPSAFEVALARLIKEEDPDGEAQTKEKSSGEESLKTSDEANSQIPKAIQKSLNRPVLESTQRNLEAVETTPVVSFTENAADDQLLLTNRATLSWMPEPSTKVSHKAANLIVSMDHDQMREGWDVSRQTPMNTTEPKLADFLENTQAAHDASVYQKPKRSDMINAVPLKSTDVPKPTNVITVPVQETVHKTIEASNPEPIVPPVRHRTEGQTNFKEQTAHTAEKRSVLPSFQTPTYPRFKSSEDGQFGFNGNPAKPQTHESSAPLISGEIVGEERRIVESRVVEKPVPFLKGKNSVAEPLDIKKTSELARTDRQQTRMSQIGEVNAQPRALIAPSNVGEVSRTNGGQFELPDQRKLEPVELNSPRKRAGRPPDTLQEFIRSKYSSEADPVKGIAGKTDIVNEVRKTEAKPIDTTLVKNSVEKIPIPHNTFSGGAIFRIVEGPSPARNLGRIVEGSQIASKSEIATVEKTVAALEPSNDSNLLQPLKKDPTQLAYIKPYAQPQAFGMYHKVQLGTLVASGDGRAVDVSEEQFWSFAAHHANDTESKPVQNLPLSSAATKPFSHETVVRQVVEASRALSQANGVQIELDPIELGRVRLSLNAIEGAVSMLISAERSDTIELLRKNIELLSQDLSELGYENLQFEFEKQSWERDQSKAPDLTPSKNAAGEADALDAKVESLVAARQNYHLGQDRLDIRV